MAGQHESMSDIDIRLTDQPLDLNAAYDFVQRPEAGGIAIFLGVVRDHNRGREVDHLVYEAYGPMAEREMRRIAEEAVARWQCRIAIHHRTGRLEIGEASVLVAVSTAHRADAFAACRYAIDTLKETVPIWKREVWSDGEAWIEGAGEAPVTAPGG